jgi:diacylglycerol kinase (ATP)
MSGPEPAAAPARQRPALVVINRSSRSGETAAEAVLAALGAAGVAVREERCDKAGQLGALIRAAAPEVGCVVVGGGDGTLSACLPGLMATGLPLGIMPLGTANDLARTLGIPEDPVAAAAIVAAGRRKRIDVGEANGRPFFNVASIGLGVDLTRALTRDAKKRWGVLGYAVAGLRTLGRMRSFTVMIQEGETFYGGGMTVSEDAAIDDGRLSVYSLEVHSIWRLLMLLPAMRQGRQGRWQQVHTLSGVDIMVRTRRPRSVDADGEITTKTPTRFRVLPGAVEVFVP